VSGGSEGMGGRCGGGSGGIDCGASGAPEEATAPRSPGLQPSRRVRAVLVDVEGTLRYGGKLLPGCALALDELRASGRQLRFLTNIDSKTPASIARSLTAAGLVVGEEEVVTPVTALTLLLESRPDVRVYALVSAEIHGYLIACGHGSRLAKEGEEADVVVVGDAHDNLDYESLNCAFRLVMAGAELVALQRQGYFMGADGYHLDTGAFAAVLEYAAGAEALVLGKPSPCVYELVFRGLGLDAADVVAVGDDVGIDVAGAKGVGARAVLVRTGKYLERRLAGALAQPDAVLSSFADLPGWLAEREGDGSG